MFDGRDKFCPLRGSDRPPPILLGFYSVAVLEDTNGVSLTEALILGKYLRRSSSQRWELVNRVQFQPATAHAAQFGSDMLGEEILETPRTRAASATLNARRKSVAFAVPS